MGYYVNASSYIYIYIYRCKWILGMWMDVNGRGWTWKGIAFDERSTQTKCTQKILKFKLLK